MEREVNIEYGNIFYVIIMARANQEKYISKDFAKRHKWDCTIKLNKAKRFGSPEGAYRFWEEWKNYDKSLKFMSVERVESSNQLKVVKE